MKDIWDYMEEFLITAGCVLVVIAIIFIIVQTVLIFQMLLKM